jgi:hypothetical protein
MNTNPNPMQRLYREALFWKTFALLTVPTLFVAVLFLTHYAHTCQQAHVAPLVTRSFQP